MRIGIIGTGSIAQALIPLLSTDIVDHVVVLARSGLPPGMPQAPCATSVVADLDGLLSQAPDLVVECAGHSAVMSHAVPILESGISFAPASLGAFADDALLCAVRGAARRGKARLIRPSGAIAGIDLVEALSLSGNLRLDYHGTKPPAAWAGTAAEGMVDLAGLRTATPFFTGTAREAARLFPKSTNVVAALALAGPGFDGVRVTLVADPAAKGNRHSYEASTPFCSAQFSIESQAAAGNARTSLTTVYSLLREITAFA